MNYSSWQSFVKIHNLKTALFHNSQMHIHTLRSMLHKYCVAVTGAELCFKVGARYEVSDLSFWLVTHQRWTGLSSCRCLMPHSTVTATRKLFVKIISKSLAQTWNKVIQCSMQSHSLLPKQAEMPTCDWWNFANNLNVFVLLCSSEESFLLLINKAYLLWLTCPTTLMARISEIR